MAKKRHRSSGKNLFALAAKDKSFKSAKRAAEKAAGKASRLWDKAVRKAKKKIKRKR